MAEFNSERRRGKRRLEDMLVRFEGKDFSIYSKAKDISPFGVFVATHYLLDPGTEISLHLIDSDGSESTHSARVVRAISRNDSSEDTTIGLGVEFINEN